MQNFEILELFPFLDKYCKKCSSSSVTCTFQSVQKNELFYMENGLNGPKFRMFEYRTVARGSPCRLDAVVSCCTWPIPLFKEWMSIWIKFVSKKSPDFKWELQSVFSKVERISLWLAIVLSVLQFMPSDYPFGIFKLFFKNKE
jgi:hypothetical protein